MITITNTNTITIGIGIANAIAIAIVTISISPRRNAHTYAHNRWEASTRFRWIIWVGDLLSPSSNCLPFLRNRRLQLSTPWPWGIMRSWHGGRAKDKVQTMISTDVMISATICHPPLATRHPPPSSRCLAPATQQVSGSSTLEHTWKHIVKWDWECTWGRARECAWERLGSLLWAYSQVGWEFAIECN